MVLITDNITMVQDTYLPFDIVVQRYCSVNTVKKHGEIEGTLVLFPNTLIMHDKY